MNAAQVNRFWQKFWRPALAVAILGCVALLAGATWNLLKDLGADDTAFVNYSVNLSDLPIIVTERGNLEAQLETDIRCEVENISVDRSGNYGTQIIMIVPNGGAVKEADLLVELDSAAIRERLDQQQLSYDRSVSQHIQAVARYENQLTQNETLEAQSKLKLDLAKLSRDMYMDEDSGTYMLDLEAIKRSAEEAKNSILESQTKLELAKTKTDGIEALFKLGYRSRQELNSERANALAAEFNLASAMNRLLQVSAERDQLESYKRSMQLLTLNGDVATAERSLKQVKLDNESQKEQSFASKIEAEKAETKELERLEKLKQQLDLCRIYAPHDGMVVYARENSRYGSSTEIAEGVTVRQRQKLLSLPDLSQMQVKTQIHEAVLDQVRPGLPTTIKVDAFPNRSYKGVVDQVAVVPTSSYFSSVKTYECVVRIVERVEQLKPGMTAVVEIHVDRLRDVLSIPVQSVVQINGETWCYVNDGDGVERRDLELGRSNDKFVHIPAGLNPGDRVILNPMAILEDAESETNEISPESNASEAPEIPEEETKKSQEQRGKSSKAKWDPSQWKGKMGRGGGQGMPAQGGRPSGGKSGGGRPPGK